MRVFEYHEIPTYWFTRSTLRTWFNQIGHVRYAFIMTDEVVRADIRALELWGDEGNRARRVYHSMVRERSDAFEERLGEFFLPDGF